MSFSFVSCAQKNTQTQHKTTEMKDYIAKIKHEGSGSISVCFYIEQDEIMSIGEKMEAINDMAYMNGYNWEAFLDYYLKKNHAEVLEGMGHDPEAGMYVAYYKGTAEDDKRADKLVEIIKDLVENESKIYKIVEEEGDEIEWD